MYFQKCRLPEPSVYQVPTGVTEKLHVGTSLFIPHIVRLAIAEGGLNPIDRVSAMAWSTEDSPDAKEQVWSSALFITVRAFGARV